MTWVIGSRGTLDAGQIDGRFPKRGVNRGS
jgi:hypothetical protein